jgi:hypothetical protein
VSDRADSPGPVSAPELKELLAAEREGEPFLMYRGADGSQRLFVLQSGGRPVTVGRSMDADVALIWDNEVSWLHAEFDASGGQWTVLDDGLSRNGTYVNGRRVSGRRRLADGDTLRFGNTTAVFRFPTQQQAAATFESETLSIVEDISPAQRRVLVALCRPYKDSDRFVTPATNQDIASEIFLSVDAVKTHLRALYNRFEVDQLPQNQKRARLAELALQWGLVSQREL